jgi:hypothetical protein
VQNQSQKPASLPSVEQLLIAGGDQRLALDPRGLNKYGCQPFPDPELLAFGSSTASVISTAGYAVADRLRQKLLALINAEPAPAVYAIEMQRIRQEWLQLCDLSDMVGLELVFAPSGTDIHAIAAQYAASGTSAPPLIIMVEANETGSGVALALNGNSVTGNSPVEVTQVSIRLGDGSPRPSAQIDAEAESLISKAVAADRRVLLILADQSKTGLIAPSPALAIALRNRFPNNIDILVDACQFRIGMPTLRAYLEQGFTVALTGSKFLTGPSFSAALLLPSSVAARLQKRAFPNGLLSCSSRGNWPTDWIGAEHLEHVANFGLLLRCEAALEELRRFRAVPQTAVIEFLLAFAEAIQQRLQSDPHFEPLPAPLLDRGPLIEADNWDSLQTIFPFLLYHSRPAGRMPLSREQTLHIYQQLPNAFDRPLSDIDPVIAPGTRSMQSPIRCQLGQPVACGTRNGVAVSALRLCTSSRLIVEALARGDKGKTIINDALNALDKTALLIQLNGQNHFQLNNH